MAKRGRKPGFIVDEKHRTKIANSQIMKRLIAFCEGKLDMEPHRAATCVALARKIVPDMQAVEHSGGVETSYVAAMPAPVRDLTEWTTTNTEQDQSVSTDNPLTTH